MTNYPEWLTATLAADAAEGAGVLPRAIHALHAASKIVGPAYVAQMSYNDNLAVRQILAAPPAPGSVLVIAGGGGSTTATIGGLMALEMQQIGIVGLVTDGLVRDAQEIRDLGFRVWCRGLTPAASKKDGPAVIGGSVQLGDVAIHDGDLVIADEDGVVIWPQAQIAVLLIKAEAKLNQDNARLAQLRTQQL